MILNWGSSDFPLMDRFLGAIFDAGMIQRQDLAVILGWDCRKMHRYLKRSMEVAPDMVRRSFTTSRTVVYSLGEDGVRYVHRMLGVQSKAIVMDAQMNHTLGINAILLRYLAKTNHHVGWFSTREATDELHRLREMAGESDLQIEQTSIRPDAFLVAPVGARWIEYDNSTESARQLLRKYRLYQTNLEKLDASFRFVAWICKDEKRKIFMERLWREVQARQKGRLIEMSFYVEGNEVDAWTETAG